MNILSFPSSVPCTRVARKSTKVWTSARFSARVGEALGELHLDGGAVVGAVGVRGADADRRARSRRTPGDHAIPHGPVAGPVVAGALGSSGAIRRPPAAAGAAAVKTATVPAAAIAVRARMISRRRARRTSRRAAWRRRSRPRAQPAVDQRLAGVELARGDAEEVGQRRCVMREPAGRRRGPGGRSPALGGRRCSMTHGLTSPSAAQGVLDVAREARAPCRAGSAAPCRRRARAGRRRSPPCARGAGRRSGARRRAKACSPVSRRRCAEAGAARPLPTAVAVAPAAPAPTRAGGGPESGRRDHVVGVGRRGPARAAPAPPRTAGASRSRLAASRASASAANSGSTSRAEQLERLADVLVAVLARPAMTKMTWSTPAAS